MSPWESRCAAVILNYNSAAQTCRCLIRLRQLHRTLPLVVVDNASTDGSVPRLRRAAAALAGCCLLEQPVNRGYAAGNNAGLRHVAHRLPGVTTVVVLNPDVLLDRADTLPRLYAALQAEPTLGLVTAQTLLCGAYHRPNECAWRASVGTELLREGTLLGKLWPTKKWYAGLQAPPGRAARVQVAQGCFFLARLSALQAVDYLDEHTFLYCEEAILAKRLAAQGWAEGVVPEAFVRHEHRPKERELERLPHRLFHMRCFYASRRYYIRAYSGAPTWLVWLAQGVLAWDHALKRGGFCCMAWLWPRQGRRAAKGKGNTT